MKSTQDVPVTVGRTVLYTLSQKDVLEIQRRRTNGQAIKEKIQFGTWPMGAQAHIGNPVIEGEVFPLIVVKTWDANTCNGQVMLDGTDTLWVTSVSKGNERGQWHWPKLV